MEAFEDTIPTPSKKKQSVVGKRVVQNLGAKDTPPKVMTFDEGQDPEYHALPMNVSNITTVSTMDDTGGLQVIEPAMDAKKAAAVAAQNKSPVTDEVIEVDDDPSPHDAVDDRPSCQIVDPAGAKTTQGPEGVPQAGQDPIVDVQTAAKVSSSRIKPLHLMGDPKLKLKRSST